MSTRRQYILNIVWGWMSAVTLILNGMLAAPFLIHKLGTETYGIWALGLSLIEYFWLIDLGLRAATVKLTAEYKALEQWDFVNSLISTAAAYSAVMGFALMCLMSFNTGFISRFFHITNPSFSLLIHVVSISWAFGLVFNMFEATLEGFQRFDITSRIFISFVLLRTVGLLCAAGLGFGLKGMSIWLLTTQLLMYATFLIALRRVYPGLRVSPRLVSKSAGRTIFRFARQLVSAMLAGRVINGGVPSLIARFLGVRFVTYYSVTQKVLDYAGEGIGRIGLITGPRAADWMARGMRPQLVRLASYGNKYCLMLWLVIATWLWVYADPLFRIWINPDFADHGTVLLRWIVFGYTFWLGQFVSASILMGIGQYTEYSIGLLVEACLTVAGYFVLLPRYGLPAALACASILVFLNRFVNLSRIFAQKLEISLMPFVWRSYRMPLLLAVADVALMTFIKGIWLPGHSWFQLILAGAINTLIISSAAFLFVLEPEHRALFIEKAELKIRALTGRAFTPAESSGK